MGPRMWARKRGIPHLTGWGRNRGALALRANLWQWRILPITCPVGHDSSLGMRGFLGGQDFSGFLPWGGSG